MSDDEAQWPRLEPWKVGIRGRCPRCGQGRLFKGFLKLAPRCEVCGLDYSFADPADAGLLRHLLRLRAVSPLRRLGRDHISAADLVPYIHISAHRPLDLHTLAAALEGMARRQPVPSQGRGRQARQAGRVAWITKTGRESCALSDFNIRLREWNGTQEPAMSAFPK